MELFRLVEPGEGLAASQEDGLDEADDGRVGAAKRVDAGLEVVPASGYEGEVP